MSIALSVSCAAMQGWGKVARVYLLHRQTRQPHLVLKRPYSIREDILLGGTFKSMKYREEATVRVARENNLSPCCSKHW